MPLARHYRVQVRAGRDSWRTLQTLYGRRTAVRLMQTLANQNPGEVYRVATGYRDKLVIHAHTEVAL